MTDEYSTPLECPDLGSLLQRNRFKLLLLTLVAVILISPAILDGLAHTAPVTARSIVFAFTMGLLMAGAMVVRGERGDKRIFIVLFVASILLDTAAAFVWPAEMAFWNHGLRILFLGFLIVELARHLLRPETVSFDTLCASLCVYLLIGLIWTNIYVIVETRAPRSIVSTIDSGRQSGTSDSELERLIHMLYFSFSTLTSVGYGDVVPRTNIARMLAVTEALVGQCYLLVMVSRLVGLHVAQAMPGGTPDKATDKPTELATDETRM
jgi:voltage-gated potassium channel